MIKKTIKYDYQSSFNLFKGDIIKQRLGGPNDPFSILFFVSFLNHSSKTVKPTAIEFSKKAIKFSLKRFTKIMWTWLEPCLCQYHLKFRICSYGDP